MFCASLLLAVLLILTKFAFCLPPAAGNKIPASINTPKTINPASVMQSNEKYSWIAQWGGNKTGVQFNYPSDICFDNAGCFYVVDGTNYRIVKVNQYNTNSNPSFNSWNIPAGNAGQSNPVSLTIGLPDPDSGNRYIYVTTTWQDNQIWRLDPASGVWSKFGNSEVKTPRGMGTDIWGYIYVVDGNYGKIYKYNDSGKLINQWPTMGANYEGPSIAVDKSGIIYFSDHTNCLIKKFSNRGALLGQWGGRGQGNGQFHAVNGPAGIAIDKNGNIYVADPGNQRIQKFKSDGTYISQCIGSDLTYPKNLYFPKTVGIDPAGLVFVVDSGNNRILAFENKIAPIDRKLIQPRIIR